MRNLLIGLIVIAIVLLTCSVMYYFVVYLPQYNANLAEQQKQQLELQQSEKQKELDQQIKEQKKQEKELRDFQAEQNRKEEAYDSCVTDGWLALLKANPSASDPLVLKEVAEQACELLR